MSEQNQYMKLITPRGVTQYPRFNKPDTGPKKSPHDPQFKTKLIFSKDGEFIKGKSKVPYADMLSQLEAMRDELFDATTAKLKQEKDVQKRKKALSALNKRAVFQPVFDEDENETNEVSLSCKMYAIAKDKNTGEEKKRTLPIFSAKGGDPLKKPPMIGGGSEVKVGLSAKAYYNATNGEVGITFYLDSVQLLKLVEFQGRNAEAYGFGKEDGYDGSDDDEAGFGDETKAEGDTSNVDEDEEF